MSDVMVQIPFHKIMERIMFEKEKYNTVFGVGNLYTHDGNRELNLFGNPLENPFGPAAGPHTQLAQNLVAAYVGGSRFFELKTVQILDGHDLHVDKPCIRADDEAYNVEWSTELYVSQAIEEYIKGYYAIKLISKEYGFGDPDKFIFNTSVGYNLEGIKSKKIDDFIEGLKDARDTEAWRECETWALNNVDEFKNIDEEYIKSISSKICNSITLSTMHGCPSDEIEGIITHLLISKKINTYLKCNPTLLGYDFVRKTMDDMGYDYMIFEKGGFESDLQYPDAVILIKKMQELARENGLTFGVKLSNTFHVKVKKNELPGEDMYMSGKALYPLTINLAAKLAKDFDGRLPMSFSGGADANNIQKIFDTGIWPITVATILLKPTGYNVIKKLATLLDACHFPLDQVVNVSKLEELAKEAISDKNYRKSEVSRKKILVSFDENKNVRMECKVTCGSCVNVCPNRANTTLMVEGVKRMLHIDDYCNECGNCYIFCPDKCTPYKDRLTLFSGKKELKESTNQGFAMIEDLVVYRYNGEVKECELKDAPQIIQSFVQAIKEQQPYL
ncbi:MAG: selenate reductase [Epulopiscium sp.]|nr:selenate reductase [Candidatus Epulonipiscium sp.]